jgi:hypothetical protein
MRTPQTPMTQRLKPRKGTKLLLPKTGRRVPSTPKGALGAHLSKLRAAGAFRAGKKPAAPTKRSKFAGD